MTPLNQVSAIPAQTGHGSTDSALATNRVIRNTYLLLSMTLAFSAVDSATGASALTAALSTALNLPHPGLVITLVGYFGLLYLTTRFRDRGAPMADAISCTRSCSAGAAA